MTHQTQITENRQLAEAAVAQVQAKVSIDDFERNAATKAEAKHVNDLQYRLEFLEYQYKQCIVVLHETLGLHVPLMEETEQTRTNRISLLMSQMGSLVNSVDQFSNRWAKINPLESITGLEVPYSH